MLDFINNHLSEIYWYIGFFIVFAWLFRKVERVKTSEQMDEFLDKRALAKSKTLFTLKDILFG